MVSVLFWNIGKRLIADQVAFACLESQCDILILAECSYESDEIVKSINLIAPVSPFSEIKGGVSVFEFLHKTTHR